MNDIFIGMKKFSKEIAIYLLYATGLFCLLYYVGGFAGGDFLPVISNLFMLLLEVALWILIPVRLGKQDIAKNALRPIFSYWLVSSVFSCLRSCLWVTAWTSEVVIASDVFKLLLACALVVIAVLIVVASIKKDVDLKKIAFLIFTGCLVFYLVVFALEMADNAGLGVGWNQYFGTIYQFITLPFGMYFLAQHFEFTLDDMKIFSGSTPKAEQKEDNLVAAAANPNADLDLTDTTETSAESSSKEENVSSEEENDTSSEND